jgi:hypothetical protein
MGMVVDVACRENAFSIRFSDNNIINYQISKTSLYDCIAWIKSIMMLLLLIEINGSSLVMASWDTQPSF